MKPLFYIAAKVSSQAAESAGALELWERREKRRPGLLRALMYHRICDPGERPDLYPGLISASPRAFASQIEWFSKHYQIVSAAEVLEASRGRRPLPPRALLLTFDDAYRDFAECAWPLLRRKGLPATLFVPTAFPDQKDRAFWWDRLHSGLEGTQRNSLETPAGRLPLGSSVERRRAFVALRRRIKQLSHASAMQWVDELCKTLAAPPPETAVLNWSELRTLAGQGVTLCPHSRTHPLLPQLPVDQAREEIVGSVQDLARNVGPTLPIFAYPSGGSDTGARRMLEQEGLELAFTTRRGLSELTSDDPLQLRRIPVNPRTTLPMLRVQLLPLIDRVSRHFS